MPDEFNIDDGFALLAEGYEFESTAKITPRALKTKAKARMINALRQESLEELLPELPEDGEYIHIISNGNYDYSGCCCAKCI